MTSRMSYEGLTMYIQFVSDAHLLVNLFQSCSVKMMNSQVSDCSFSFVQPYLDWTGDLSLS